jgi:hypothetical protein
LVLSQTIFIHHPELQFLFEDSLLHDTQYQSVFKPIEISRSSFNKYFTNTDTLSQKPFQQRHLWVSPVVDASATFVKQDQRILYQLGEGLYIAASHHNFGFEASGEIYEQSFPASSKFVTDSLKLAPRFNRLISGGNGGALNLSLNGLAYWKPIPFVTLTIGNDKQFWGDGYRSLLLSENAASYPFIQAKINVWKIAYEHQVLFLKDLIAGKGTDRFNKFASMHLLSCNVSPSFNFYIFEAVVWQQQDSGRHRGVDIQYLNPTIFFRSVEYNIGSPDNMLMGLGGKLKLWDHVHFYGQFMLDEFNLKAIVKNWGWWGNKHGLQAGLKIYGSSPRRPQLFQVEYNLVRPYTYSHYTSLVNYGYLRQPLAHPDGANFEEFLALYRIAFTKLWMVHVKGAVTFYGTDPAGKNYGSDIYEYNSSYVSDYGNHLGQGIPTYDFAQELIVSRMLKPAWRLRAGLIINNTVRRVEGKTMLLPTVQLGINTLLYE